MSETLAAYWGPRPESPEAAAAWLAPLLEILGAGEHWYEVGSAGPAPEDAVDASPAGLAARLEKGRNRRDMDKSVITELGYSLTLWDGHGDDATSLSAQVGATSTTPGTGNNVVIKLPAAEQVHARADELFPALVEASDPDRAIWMTREYRRTQQTIDGLPYVGWHSYLTEPYADRVVTVPDGVTTRPLHRGLWVTAGDAPGEASQGLAARVAEQL